MINTFLFATKLVQLQIVHRSALKNSFLFATKNSQIGTIPSVLTKTRYHAKDYCQKNNLFNKITFRPSRLVLSYWCLRFGGGLALLGVATWTILVFVTAVDVLFWPVRFDEEAGWACRLRSARLKVVGRSASLSGVMQFPSASNLPTCLVANATGFPSPSWRILFAAPSIHAGTASRTFFILC